MKKYTVFLLYLLLSGLLFTSILSHVSLSHGKRVYAVITEQSSISDPDKETVKARIIHGTGTDCLNFILKDLSAKVYGSRENNNIYSNYNGKWQDGTRNFVSNMFMGKQKIDNRKTNNFPLTAIHYLSSSEAYYIALRQIRI